MNRAFLILLAPALLVALLYLGLGYRPAPMALGGAILFVGLLVYVLRRQTARKQKLTPQSSPPNRSA